MKKIVVLYLCIESVLLFSCAEECDVSNNNIGQTDNIVASVVSFEDYNTFQVSGGGDTLSRTQFAIYLDVEADFSAATSSVRWPNQLMACTPEPPQLAQSVTSIEVTSLLDYNAEIAAGDDMTEQFSFIAFAEPVSLSFLPELNQFFRYEFELFLRPEVFPNRDRSVVFEVTVTLDDGQIFTLQTQPVYLQIN
jgi:hypothetical protein